MARPGTSERIETNSDQPAIQYCSCQIEEVYIQTEQTNPEIVITNNLEPRNKISDYHCERKNLVLILLLTPGLKRKENKYEGDEIEYLQ